MIYPAEREDLTYTLSRLRYFLSLGFSPFHWQREVLESPHKRKHINGARQAGKSTIISGLPCHRARFFPGSLSIILAATEKQAVEDMERVKAFMARDPRYPKITRDSDSLLELDNRSRVLVVPATEKAARGYSSPDIIMLDEASRIEDGVYKSGVRPMLTDNDKCEVCSISTPNGRTGHFFQASQSKRWERYVIKAPWEIDEATMQLIAAVPEERFRTVCQEQGVHGYYSPRHANWSEQQENLEEMTSLLYRQEYLCEYVEPEEQVFSYAEISRIFSQQAEALPMAVGDAPQRLDFPPL